MAALGIAVAAGWLRGPTLIGAGSVPVEEVALAVVAAAWGWRVAERRRRAWVPPAEPSPPDGPPASPAHPASRGWPPAPPGEPSPSPGPDSQDADREHPALPNPSC